MIIKVDCGIYIRVPKTQRTKTIKQTKMNGSEHGNVFRTRHQRFVARHPFSESIESSHLARNSKKKTNNVKQQQQHTYQTKGQTSKRKPYRTDLW
jgi:hypothetical protein